MKILRTAFFVLMLVSAQVGALPVSIDFEDASGKLLRDLYVDQGIQFDPYAFGHDASVYGLPDGFVPYSGDTLMIGWANGPDLRLNSVGGSWSEIGAHVTASGTTTLSAYDMYGQLLGVASSGGDNTLGNTGGREANMYLSIESPNIAYATFSNSGQTRGLTVDNIHFAVPDVSATWHLLAIATAALLALRSRRYASFLTSRPQ